MKNTKITFTLELPPEHYMLLRRLVNPPFELLIKAAIYEKTGELLKQAAERLRDLPDFDGFDRLMVGSSEDDKIPTTEQPTEKHPLFDEAVTIVRAEGKAGTALLQRRLNIGYVESTRLMDQMEGEGIIGAKEGGKQRKVL